MVLVSTYQLDLHYIVVCNFPMSLILKWPVRRKRYLFYSGVVFNNRDFVRVGALGAIPPKIFLENNNKTIKYPTVCPIHLIKWPLFDWSQKYINVIKNPPTLLYMLKYIGEWFPRSLGAKFSPPFKLQESKVENRKKWPLY